MSLLRILVSLLQLVLVGLAAGCLAKTAVEPVRYFSPGPPTPTTAPEPTAKVPSQVWLRRITAAGHLDQRMARRTTDVEIGFNDLERWTDPPVSLVERALVRELFETSGVERADASRTARLDVDVLAFEERMVPEHTATVAIAVSLFDGRDISILERTFMANSDLASSDPEVVARAMGLALGRVARAASTAVIAALPKK